MNNKQLVRRMRQLVIQVNAYTKNNEEVHGELCTMGKHIADCLCDCATAKDDIVNMRLALTQHFNDDHIPIDKSSVQIDGDLLYRKPTTVEKANVFGGWHGIELCNFSGKGLKDRIINFILGKLGYYIVDTNIKGSFDQIDSRCL